MRLKKLLTKTLLVAAGLSMGASAWGATTWDFSDSSIWGSRSSKSNTSIYTGGDSEVYYNPDGTVGTSATSYVSFLYDAGNVSFNYGGRSGLSADGTASTTANRIKVNVPVGASATITVASASGSRKIAVHDGTSVVKEFTSSESYTYTNTSTTDAKNIYIYNSSNPAATQQVIKSISIAETFTITTHYYYNDEGNNVSIVDDKVAAVESGSSYTLPYEETILLGDYIYTYSSGAQTIASVSASAEYSIYYTRSERPKYSVSVKAKYGDNTVTIVESAEYSEGEIVKYYAPAYYLDGTTLYAFPEDDEDDNDSDGITWGGAYTVTAAKDIVLNYEAQEGEFVAYVEGEDLSGAYAQQDAFKDLMSNGTGGVISSGNPAKVATLPAGVYKLTIRSIGRSSDASNARTCSVVVGDETTSWTQTTSGSINTLNIELTESTDIYAYGGYKTSSANAWNLDFIYIQKTGDVTVPVTITAAGYATYCSPYALDFSGVSENVKAYFITGAEGNSLTLSEALSTVPANQGVLLIGAEDNYNIPVIASSSTVATENKLIGVTAETADVAAGIYVLMDETNGVGFYKTTSAFTVGANTAYLPADIAGAGVRAFYGFGDATAISAVKTVKADGEVYNLNGQRVAAPQKGLYIVNGKKVIIK